MSSSARNTAILTAVNTYRWIEGANGTMIYERVENNRAKFEWFAGGSMFLLMSAIGMYVCLMMRQRQKRIQEATSLNNLPWVERLEVFTLTGLDAATGVYMPPATPATPGSPPAYDSVVPTDKAKEAGQADVLRIEDDRKQNRQEEPETSDDLPTYEAAIQMDGKR